MVNANDAPGGASPPLHAHLLGAMRLFLGDCPIPERSRSGRSARSLSERDWSGADRCFAEAHKLFRAIGMPEPPNQQDERDELVARCRDALGEASYASRWTEGTGASLDDGSALAVALLGEVDGEADPRVATAEGDWKDSGRSGR